jgi:hypothetical protein
VSDPCRRSMSRVGRALRLGTAAGAIALAAVLLPTLTPAWSVSSACPTKLASPSAGSPSAGECSEDQLEEELEQREDEEEEQAIAAERAAAGVEDAAEEAAEEAQLAADLRDDASHPSDDGKAKLKLQVEVSTIRRRSPLHPAETRISVASNIPARVRVRVKDAAGRAKLYRGTSTNGRRNFARVSCGCLTSRRRYSYTVTAYAEHEGKTGVENIVIRRGGFTIDSQECARRALVLSSGLKDQSLASSSQRLDLAASNVRQRSPSITWPCFCGEPAVAPAGVAITVFAKVSMKMRGCVGRARSDS